jgi:hypothetical protein
MWRRPFLAAAVSLSWLVAQAAPAGAADLFAQLFPLSGEIRLVNKGATPIPFVFYSITSASGALDGGSEVWRSIADYYDASGNGLIDPAHEWFKLSDDPTELTEAVFAGPGGIFPARRAISLGQIWNPSAVPFPDLVFDIQDDEQAVPVTIELAMDGDYSSNQVVDSADYVLWRRYLNSTTMLLADGNLNGVIDTADYLVWQENFGRTVPLPPYAAGSGSRSPQLSAYVGVVPEPASGALLLLAMGWYISLARRRAGGWGRAFAMPQNVTFWGVEDSAPGTHVANFRPGTLRPRHPSGDY